jgi:glucosamine--fructose-6-phosphate aminotransferase (isomerizing)
MCGIVGYIGGKASLPLLIDGLYKLEYRGYDSSGVVLYTPGGLKVFRTPGKIRELEAMTRDERNSSGLGIGHTRWATHGKPSQKNAHPHLDCRGAFAVVHNGIIENHAVLRRELAGKGHVFTSETDTEVLAHLLEEQKAPPLEALLAARERISGYYAFAMIHKDHPEALWAARLGPPLLIGLGEGETSLASDYMPILPHTKRVVILEDYDVAEITKEGVRVFGRDGKPVERPVLNVQWDTLQAEKGGFRHYMLKEIHEQPQAVRDTFNGSLSFESSSISLEGFDLLGRARRILIPACGTSWHAGLIGKFYFENLAGIPTEVEYASELRYRHPILTPDTLLLGISQSGETADTIASLRLGLESGCRVASICNVQGSEIHRMSHATFLTKAGPEIGVASTKAFTTQLTALFLMALYARQAKGGPVAEHFDALQTLPHLLDQVLRKDAQIQELARLFFKKRDFLYLGRGVNYPIALEGALKLKEISYIHAEGYPAGEMKHGPIALIDETMPVVAVATPSEIQAKMLANMEEVRARDGILIGVVGEGDEAAAALCTHAVEVPVTHPLLQPLINILPLQLLAYHVAVRLGCDVDQPRNLAKSVTVE